MLCNCGAHKFKCWQRYRTTSTCLRSASACLILEGHAHNNAAQHHTTSINSSLARPLTARLVRHGGRRLHLTSSFRASSADCNVFLSKRLVSHAARVHDRLLWATRLRESSPTHHERPATRNRREAEKNGGMRVMKLVSDVASQCNTHCLSTHH
jgi:hypothetical protein